MTEEEIMKRIDEIVEDAEGCRAIVMSLMRWRAEMNVKVRERTGRNYEGDY